MSAVQPAQAFAPAKVNLFLHVGPPTPDGYHPLSSLMVFADVGDTLRLEPAPAGAGLSLRIEGEFAGALAGEATDDNLVLRGVRRLLERAGRSEPDARFVLDKALPVAAGLGGGSSDAGAALRLAGAAFAPELSEAELETVAAGLGADGPACLRAAPVLGLGRGDVLRSAPPLPLLHAVLVNPRVACPTGAVYRAYDAAAAPGGAEPAHVPSAAVAPDEVIAALKAARNDLEAPAIGVAPVIAEVLAALRAQPEAVLARLSGSGATAFALCRSAEAAGAVARALAADPRGWWVRAARLGGPWPGEGT